MPTGGPFGANTIAVFTESGAYSANGTGNSRIYTTNVSLSVDLSQLASLDHLRFSFSAPQSTGNGFDSLTFQILKESSLIENQTFATLSAANAYFGGTTLDFGVINSGVIGTLDLQFNMSLTSHTVGDSFQFTGGVANIPEPGSVSLLVIGLSLFVLRRRHLRNS